MELWYNERPRDWQNMFIITMFVKLYRGSFSYRLIFYYCWSQNKMVCYTEDFVIEVPLIKSEDFSINYGFLKQIISADDVVSDTFQWHTRQNEGITGTYSVMICKLLVVDSACVITLSRRRVLFSGLKFMKSLYSTMAQERFSNLTVLNSHKERTAKFALSHPPPNPPHTPQCRWSPLHTR